MAANAGAPYTDRLRDLLVDMLVGGGDTSGAVRVRREEFARHPTAAGYRSLIDTVETVGGDDPTTWALGVLRDRITQQPAYASELVDVLLAVGRDGRAWQEALHHRRWLGGPQWQTLLQRRAVTHPEEVIQPYRDLVEQAILNSADKRRYRRAVALLPALRAAYQATGEDVASGRYLAELRIEHKRRPTFLKALDAAGLSPTHLPIPGCWNSSRQGSGPTVVADGYDNGSQRGRLSPAEHESAYSASSGENEHPETYS